MRWAADWSASVRPPLPLDPTQAVSVAELLRSAELAAA
jgi:hypothetical protein